MFDIKKFSIHDGPGIRTTVFFKGCPLSCWWCHNPESQAPDLEMMFWANRCIRCEACLPHCTQGAISWNGDLASTDGEKCTLCGACVEACYAEAREIMGREMTVDQVMTEIEKDIAFYDESGGGVTFSGGEPLLQREFLLALLQACKEREIHTAVDTCGFATWETFDSVREHVDLFLYDLKLMDDSRHRRFTGVSNQLILRNLQMLSARGHSIILRVPIIPEINDDDWNIRQIGAFAAAVPRLMAAGALARAAEPPVPAAQVQAGRAGVPASTCDATTGAPQVSEGRAVELNRVDILPYHQAAVEKLNRLGRVCGLPETRPPSDEKMAEIARTLRGFGLHVKIGG